MKSIPRWIGFVMPLAMPLAVYAMPADAAVGLLVLTGLLAASATAVAWNVLAYRIAFPRSEGLCNAFDRRNALPELTAPAPLIEFVDGFNSVVDDGFSCVFRGLVRSKNVDVF